MDVQHTVTVGVGWDVREPFAARHPYRFVAALQAMVLAVYLIAGTVAQLAGLPGLWLYAIANGVLAVAVAVLLTAMGWWRRVGFRAPRRPRDLLWFLVPFLPVAVYFLQRPGFEFSEAWTLTINAVVIVVFTAYGGYVMRGVPDRAAGPVPA